jgi:2-haloalkanoic acid dehalogenase type II
MPLNYDNYDALSFDCYGTLIDWERGIWLAFQPLLLKSVHLQIDQKKVLAEFAAFENEIQSNRPDMPYPEVLKGIHKQFAEKYDLVTNEEFDRAFGASVREWPVFLDTIKALADLKKRYKLVILSNVDEAGFAASNERLSVEFDAIYTAEKIGSYKPDVRNFEYLFAQLLVEQSIPRERILHVAQSLYHDIQPAKMLGMDCVWIDRQGLSTGGDWGATSVISELPEADAVFTDLASFAQAVANS